MNGSVSYGFAPGSTLVGDTVYVCQNDSLFFTTSDDEYVHNDTVYFINFSSYQWNQFTCSPFSTTILPSGTPFASPGDTAWNLNALASTPGLYLFGVSALCQYVYLGDTTTTDTVADYIFLRIRPAPLSNAGNDTLFCLSTSGTNPWVIQLDGNNPSPFVGYWTINDLHGNYSFQDSTDFNTFVYLANNPYNYNSEFSWTVIDTTTGCSSTDLVNVKHPMEIHPVNIYPDTIVVCDNRIQLGPLGIQGTNYITQYGGFTGPVTNPTQYTFGDSIYYEWTETSSMPDSLITINYTAQVVEIIVDSAGFYNFDLSIYGYCGNSSDQVVIQFLSDSTLGPPIPVWTYNCNDSTNFTVVHTAPPSGATVNYLFIQPDSSSTGSMSFTSINDSTVRILNLIDTIPYVQLQYSFTWAGSTCIKTALITIYNEYHPWQNVQDTILPCGQTAYNFLLSAPGQSVWTGQTPVYNQSFTLIQEAIPASYLNGGYIYNMNIPGDYKIKIMRWSACGDTLIDTLKITTLGPPPPPSAGIPLLVPCGATEINLASNVPVWGNGIWSLPFPIGLPTSHPDFNPGGFPSNWVGLNFSDSTSSHTTVSNLVVPGDYYFVWNISSGSCGNFYDTLTVYVPDPIYDTAYAGIDTIICDTTAFWLNAAEHPVFSGYWSQDSLSNPNIISFTNADSSSTQVIGMIPGGSYQFFYHLNGACNSATDSVTVIYDICCLASVDPVYQKWWNDTLIDQPTVLSGKYYVDGMVTVSELIDITNVDMVFGTCGGITFIDNAQIRANNSVFRPCNYFDNWIGFRWNGANNSIIEACTFKNACIGIEIGQGGNIQIKHNLFNNNAIGIALRETRQNEAISGNQFIWDSWRDTLFARVCPSQIPQTNVITGITALNSNVRTVISNNEFTGAAFQPGDTQYNYLRFEGVNFTNGNVHLSNNRFTNNTCAFFGHGGDYILSNNTVETNTPNIYHTADIFLDSVNFADISQNQLLNHVAPAEIRGLDKTGVYINSLYGGVVSVEGNKIEGFYNGLVARNSKGEIFVNENEISNFFQNGIFADNSLINISCNTLNGRISDEYLPNGIWLLVDQAGFDYIGNSKIRSNCIFETNYAVIIQGVQNDTVDVGKNIFTNNFMYNYHEIGLYVIGYGMQSGPGNSFVSNNNGNGYSTDIHTSNANVRSVYDYGIKSTESNFGFGVQIDSLDILHSTASCGTQISDYQGNAGNEAQMTNLFTVCLPIKLDSANVYEGWGEGIFRIKAAAAQNLSVLPSVEADRQANFLLGITKLNPDPAKFDEAFSYFETLNNLSDFGTTALHLKNAMQKNDFMVAKNILSNFSPNNLELQEWKLIHERLVNHFLIPASYQEIEGWDRNGLQLERSILVQQYYIHALHQTRPSSLAQLPILAKAEKGNRTVLSNEPEISVYPNPVSEELNLLINCKDQNPLLIEINNISGELVYQQSSTVSSGILKINLASLNSGLYLVKLSDAEGNMKAVKFVKQ
jgi:hypothetical protein